LSLADTPHAAEVLAAGADLLDGLGLWWWLSAGTALGVVRDGRLIPHDTDLDVGVLDDPPGVLDRVHLAFAAVGWAPARTMPYQRAYTSRGVIFDVYAYRRSGDQLVADTDCGRLAKPAGLFDPLAWLPFAGRLYPLPSPPAEYLQVRYGPGWRTPTRSKGPWQAETAALVR
jgi:phosphorylcholine metabolism protein LicD